MKFETPAELLARLKLGREEYCQRLLTTLLLQGRAVQSDGGTPRGGSRCEPAWDPRRLLTLETRMEHDVIRAAAWAEEVPAGAT